jgi:pyruvate dehydrogenase E2 component (dihydrolipoamide acetyltransferase)
MTATHDFLVPDLGEGLEDATITAWAVAVGDTVELNQVLCTVETNKAAVEIPSPYAGVVTELGGAEGQTLAVGAVLVRIATDVPAAAVEATQPKAEPEVEPEV